MAFVPGISCNFRKSSLLQTSVCNSKIWITGESLFTNEFQRGSNCSLAGVRQSPRMSLSYAERKGALLEVLKRVVDPDLNQDIVSLGFVKNILFEDVPDYPSKSNVKFSVELTTPACPVKDQFQLDCKNLAESLPWVHKAEVEMTAQAPNANQKVDTGALDNVGAIIAAASCKGGVGKSATSVNLAYSLAALGAKVGIMDTDIYGPSLPTLVRPDSDVVQFVENRIRPLNAHGVKLMSFGYVNSSPAIMRGPMISNVMNQLLTTTEWGILDYLIIDMPPGTGDIQLTLSQVLKMTAAVIVTTPQKLSYVDVAKGIDMFEKVSVPCVAVVENMSYFVAPESGVKHYIFGSGHREKLEREHGIANSFSMPIDPLLSETCDSGIPYVVTEPDSTVSQEYKKLSGRIVQEVAKIQHGGSQVPIVEFDEESGDIVVRLQQGKEEQRIWPPSLRRRCQCALCIDEMTGAQRLKPEDVKETVKPVRITPVGNYAIEIFWSDSHNSLYPYSRFVENWSTRDPSQASNKAKVERVAASEPAGSRS